MAKEPHQALKALVDRIMDATKEDRQKMDRYLRRFRGEWWNETELDENDSRVFVNFVFSTIMTIAPHLTSNRLQWSARARLPFFQNYINGWKLSADYLWDKEDLDFKLLDAVMAALIMKAGLWKIYFEPSEDTGGEVCVDVVDPRTFFVAPGYDDIWDAPLCGTVERKPLSWIREFFPERGKEVKPEQISADRHIGDSEPFVFHDLFANFYTVWFRDAEAEAYFVQTEGGEPKKEDKASRAKARFAYFTDDVWLSSLPCEYRHGKPPYVMLYDYRIPFQAIGGGEVDQIEFLNASFNRNLQLMDRYATFYSDPPIFVDAAGLGIDFDQFKQQYKKGGGVFEYNGMTTADKKPIWTPDQKPMNRAVLDEMGLAPQFIQELSGTPDIIKGTVSKQQRQSATEIGTLSEFGMGRTRGRVANLEHFLKRAYYLILSMQMQYYTEPRNFSYRNTDEGNNLRWDTISNLKMTADRMVGPMRSMDPNQASDSEQRQIEQDQKDYDDFVEFTKNLGEADPVYAAFDLEVQTTTTLPLDQQSLANLYLRLLQMGGGNPVTGMPLWKAALRNLRVPGYREIISEIDRLFEESKGGQQGQQGPSPASPLANILNQGGTTV